MKANDKIGLLTLIKKVPRPKDKKREGTYWQCQCECGKIVSVFQRITIKIVMGAFSKNVKIVRLHIYVIYSHCDK